MLGAWGRLVHRHRRIALVASLVLLAASLSGVAQGGRLLTYQPPQGAESSRGFDLLQEQLPSFSASSFVVVFSSVTLRAEDPAFERAVRDALRPLATDPRVEDIAMPYGAQGVVPNMASRDGRSAIAVVTLDLPHDAARLAFDDIYGKIRSPTLSLLPAGELAVNAGFEETLQTDLKRAEIVSIPLTLLLLLAVFGTAVAALLPVGVGVLAVAGGVGAVLAVSNLMDVSVYAMNVVSLIGLGVAIDYSLFIVSRHREETAAGLVGEEAMARTMETAGRAVLFSGLTVAVGLLGLSFFRGMYFASMGLAGGLVVAFAIVYSLVFLPALLALLGPRIDRWRVPFVKGGAAAPRESRFWHSVALRVMRRPVTFLLAATLLVLVAAAPFAHIHLATATESALPEHAASRRGVELLRAEFEDAGSTRIHVVLHVPDGEPLDAQRAGAAYDYSRAIARVPGVREVQSVVDLDPSITRAQYQQMYAEGAGSAPVHVRPAIREYVGESILVLSVLTDASAEGNEARRLVEDLRALPPPPGTEAFVTGPTAFDVDTLRIMEERLPYALAFIIVATYLLLLAQTRSILLPAKALLMNVLSIAAAFGAMVWIFQDGHLAGFLGFTPAPIDPSLPVLLFCIVFGLSMDYEVLLLARMHEEYERTGDNTQAVALGLEKSGRLITSAAAIMVVVFASFATAEVTLIKAIGLGLALAILIDATLVRALIVPSAMRLMGRWNWWGPRWLRARHP